MTPNVHKNDAHELHRWRIERRQQLEQLAPPTWSQDVTSVDRQTQPCDVARVGSRFAAITTHGNGVVEIVASTTAEDGVSLTENTS